MILAKFAVVLVLSVVFNQSPDPRAGTQHADFPELLPLLKPELGKMKKPIRDKLASLHDELETLIARGDLTRELLADAYGRMGEYYQAHSLLDAAEVMLRNAQSLAPEEPRWPYFLGTLHEDRNQFPEAIAHFQQVIALRPHDHHALGRLGYLYLQLNQPEQARAALEKALAVAPNEAFLLHQMGLACSALNQTGAAIQYLEKALEKQPQADSLYYPLGLAYRKAGEMAKAREAIGEHGEGKTQFNDPYLNRLSEITTLSTLDVALAMAADPAVNARDFMGYILTNLGGRPGLIEYLSAALEHKKETASQPQPFEWARIHYAIGNLLAKEDSDDDALFEFEEAMALAPGFVEPFLEKAFLLRKAGDHRAAVQLYNRLLASTPAHEEALMGRALAYLGQGAQQKALADLEKLAGLAPELADARLELAKLYLVLDQGAKALPLFQQLVIEETTDDVKAFAHGQLGILRQRRGEHESAVDHYRTSLQYDDRQVGARLNLAAALAHLNHFEEAVAQYQTIIHQDPSHEVARLGHIAALILDARYPAAQKALWEARKTLPENVAVAHILARFLAAVPEPELRDGQQAVILTKWVLARDKAFSVGETYAMALAQTGRFEEALSWQRALIASAEQEQALKTLNRLRANLERYEAGLTCCDTPQPVLFLP